MDDEKDEHLHGDEEPSGGGDTEQNAQQENEGEETEGQQNEEGQEAEGTGEGGEEEGGQQQEQSGAVDDVVGDASDNQQQGNGEAPGDGERADGEADGSGAGQDGETVGEATPAAPHAESEKVFGDGNVQKPDEGGGAEADPTAGAQPTDNAEESSGAAADTSGAAAEQPSTQDGDAQNVGAAQDSAGLAEDSGAGADGEAPVGDTAEAAGDAGEQQQEAEGDTQQPAEGGVATDAEQNAAEDTTPIGGAGEDGQDVGDDSGERPAGDVEGQQETGDGTEPASDEQGEKPQDTQGGDGPSDEQQGAKPEDESGEGGQDGTEGAKPADETGQDVEQKAGDTAGSAEDSGAQPPQAGEQDGDGTAADASQAQQQSDANATGDGQAQGEATEASQQQEGEDGITQQQTAEGGDGTTEQQQQEGEGGEPKEQVDGLASDTRGDEERLVTESAHEDDEPKIPDDFYYNIEEHESRAKVSQDSGLPMDLLSLSHSFGYDCKRRANLHMIDEWTCLFAAGNVVQLLNLQTKEQKYLRSTSGGGIGAIAIHPLHKYIAVGEKGDTPNINVYEYPSLKLYRIMRGGTERAYSYIDFSPDGTLIASVGADPDYMLTVWDWKQEKIQLRSKAFSQEVFRVTFSTELQGQLTSSGTGHIRFWKMASTFTGLKLQGELGKFGKTEISDIEGYVELPDGKVLSGSEWGNMLLWDGGLIKVEISRKNGKPCHVGPIQQIIMDEGELITIGVDGYVRVWDFESVDTADVTDTSPIFEMEAMNELKVGNNVRLRSIVKAVNSDDPIWFAQDASGGIWKLDLSFSFTSQTPEKLASYHSGTISAVDASPNTHLSATAGFDRTVRVYDYVQKQQLCESRFNQPATSLMWMPTSVDEKGSLILAGFYDGVVRALTFQKATADSHTRRSKDQSELSLKQVFKPHKDRVTAMALDSNKELLATAGNDATVFFFTVGDTFDPIGFVPVSAPVTHICWSPMSFDSNTLLVCCDNGDVLEIDAPEQGKFDTSKTFQITGLPIKKQTFKSIKSRLRHEEELAIKAKEREERKKKEAEERRKRIERGLESESDAGEEEESEDEEEEEWSPYIPETPSPILYGCYGTETGKYWLSMGDFDAGYLYEYKFLTDEEKKKMATDQVDEPLRAIAMVDNDDTPISYIMRNAGSSMLIMGLLDGSLRIHSLASNDIGALGPCWQMSMHDNNYGKITKIAISFDEKYLFTVGKDGNFFTFHVMDQERIASEIEAAKVTIPSARDLLKVDDIEDVKAYSIEDAKQKDEYDKMMRLAEEKKARVRATVSEMQKKFRTLLEKNEQLPEHLRLDRKEFEMDAEIKKELQRQTANKIELVKKEMAWEEEKHRIALEKLRNRFKVDVECERIVVRAFLSAHEVSSFRASKLPEDFYLTQAEMERKRTQTMSKDETSRQTTAELLQAQKQGTELGDGATGEGEGGEAKITTTLKGSMGERITKALAKVEEKKKKRAARKAEWEELLSSKPDDNYSDPDAVAAINEARENMGDYKLKSADDYVVPDHLRMNTEKAKSRLLAIKDLIHQTKYVFNQRLLALRDKKIAKIDRIAALVEELDMVQSKLDAEEAKPLPRVPTMHPDELPEKRFEYTRESLLRFKEEYAERMKAAQEGGGAAGAGGFGGFGGGGAAPAAASKEPEKHHHDLLKATPTSSSISFHHKQSSNLTTERTMHEPDWSMAIEEEKHQTELEKRIEEAQQIRMIYERDRLFKEINEILQNFDAELRCLRHDKYSLEVELKNADLRQVTLFEELLLLKDFEKSENILADRVAAKQQEKLDMHNKLIEVQQKLDNKKKDIEKLQEKERQLYSTFSASLGENNKFYDFLQKVFKKKIKRSKKTTGGGEGSDEESDEDSDDDSDWTESEDESDSESGAFDLDVCPPGCDQTLYDNTCAVREKRLDIEEALVEEKKNRDALNKEQDALNKKAKIIESSLKSAENELEAFQLEKQRKVNELDVVVTLKLHQLQHVINGHLPQDLTACLVFEAPAVTRLQQRIRELEHEKTLQKKQQKEAKKKHIRLIKDRKVFQHQISDMEEETDKMMIQKFGRVVDLEKLETVTVNRALEELKEKLRQAEWDSSLEIASWDEKIQAHKDRITELIRENTNRLDQLNMLLGEKRQYEKNLDSQQKNLGGEYSGARKSDIHERQRLIQLVQLQAQEIEALKEEITLLSRKGGHILPPAQPPLPQTNHPGLPPNV